MPCRQVSTYNGTTGSGKTGGGGYATEAECLQACQEGACCEGTTCTVKPQCQCQGTGKVFKGVGTTCTPNPCTACCDGDEYSRGGDVRVSLSFSLQPRTFSRLVVGFGGYGRALNAGGAITAEAVVPVLQTGSSNVLSQAGSIGCAPGYLPISGCSVAFQNTRFWSSAVDDPRVIFSDYGGSISSAAVQVVLCRNESTGLCRLNAALNVFLPYIVPNSPSQSVNVWATPSEAQKISPTTLGGVYTNAQGQSFTVGVVGVAFGVGGGEESWSQQTQSPQCFEKTFAIVARQTNSWLYGYPTDSGYFADFIGTTLGTISLSYV